MRRVVLLGFLLLLVIDTTSNVVIKIAGNRIGEFGEAGWLERLGREPLILVIIACYVAAFLTYTSLLKHAPVGPAFAAVHGHVVTVLLVSLAVFGERLSALQWAGCGLVVAGIIVLGLTERLEAPARQAPERSAPD